MLSRVRNSTEYDVAVERECNVPGNRQDSAGDTNVVAGMRWHLKEPLDSRLLLTLSLSLNCL